MTRHGGLLALFLLAATAPAVAAPLDKLGTTTVAPMSLPDSVEYALTHSSTVAQQMATVTTAQHSYALQAGTAYPQVGASVQSFLAKSANYQGQFAAVGLSQQSVVSQNTAQVGISNWNLTSGGFAFLTLAADRALVVQAQNTLANTEDQIATSVTNSFYTIAQRQAVVIVDLANVKYQNVLVDVSKAKEHAGVAAGVDVLQAQSQQAKGYSQLVADRSAVADASQTLAQQIGAPLLTTFVMPETIPEPALPNGGVEKLVTIADVNRPDVAAAQELVNADRATRKGWNVELFPTVQISAGLGNQFSPTGAVQEQEQFNAECTIHPYPPGSLCPPPTVPRGSFGFWNLQAVSTFTLPLIDYNGRHSERVNDDAQLASAESTFAQTRLQAELDVRTSYRAAQTAQAQVVFARQEAVYGTEAARIAQLQYKAGVKTIYDVLQAQQNAVSAQDDYVNARVNYVDAVVKLRVSLGTYSAQSAVADLK